MAQPQRIVVGKKIGFDKRSRNSPIRRRAEIEVQPRRIGLQNRVGAMRSIGRNVRRKEPVETDPGPLRIEICRIALR